MKTDYNRNVDYGTCDYCGGDLFPVWFTQEETVVKDGMMYKTGRKRKAVSHLVCECCLRNFVVDDSFDLPWYK